MKVLIVMPRFSCDTSQYYYQPQGLLFVSSYLKQKGFDVKCLNLNHYGPKKLTEVLSSDAFDVVCTGGMHVHYHPVKEIVDETKAVDRRIRVVVGGGLVTAHPQFAVKHLDSDFHVLHEGEETCANLLTALKNDENPENVLGIAFKKNGDYFETPEAPLIENLDTIPFPDYESFEYDYYLDNYSFSTQLGVSQNSQRTSYVAGSRDCPAKCTFCYRIMHGSYRVRSVDNVMKEIRYQLDRFKINDLYVNDEIFAMNKNRVIEFCEKIKPFNLQWNAQMRVNMADENILRLMKDAGCQRIGFGFESGSQPVLKSMKKGIRVEQIETAMVLTKKAKMSINANFIFGDPAETVETARETFDFYRRHKGYGVLAIMLAPYPGTSLYYDFLNKNVIKDPVKFFVDSYDDNGDVVNLTDMSDDEYRSLRLKTTLEEEKNRVYGKVTQCEDLGELYELSLNCPHCASKITALKIGKAYLLSNQPRCACKDCCQWIYFNRLELPVPHNSVKRFLQKTLKKIYFFMIYLLTLKFEPSAHDNNKAKPLYFPIIFFVEQLKLNSLLWSFISARKRKTPNMEYVEM